MKFFEDIGNTFRQKRFSFFKECIESLPKPIHIIDLGGTELFWAERGFRNDDYYQITLVNTDPQHPEERCSNIRSIKADVTDLSFIKDNTYDISFSNSVIEHLYTWENQRKMAFESRRISKYYFIQTPNKCFPVEPHYILPFFQYLHSDLKFFILTQTPLSRLKYWDKAYAKQYIEEIRLLSYNELQRLFPDSRVYFEKFLGMNKSFTCHNFKVF